jgi:hypothetical protein
MTAKKNTTGASNQMLRPTQSAPDLGPRRQIPLAEQAHQQSLAVASSRHEADDQAFIGAPADDE